MNQDREKLVAKIQALLNKADTARGATVEEADAFMRKARELMAKHQIEEMEMAQLDGESTPAFDLGREDVDMTHVRRNSDLYVARVLKEAFDVHVIHSQTTNGKQRYILLGDAVDRAVARIAIPALYSAMFYGYKEWVRKNARGWVVGEERSYCQGVADGYLHASDEGKSQVMKTLSKKQQEQFGLILVDKKDAVAKYVKEQFPKLGSIKGRASRGSDSAYQQGHATGAGLQLNPSKKIKGNGGLLK